MTNDIITLVSSGKIDCTHQILEQCFSRADPTGKVSGVDLKNIRYSSLILSLSFFQNCGKLWWINLLSMVLGGLSPPPDLPLVFLNPESAEGSGWVRGRLWGPQALGANKLAVIPSHSNLYQLDTIDVFVRTAIEMHRTSVKK